MIRSGLHGLDSADSTGLLALAQFLADGTPSDRIQILARAEVPRAPAPARSRRGRWFIYGGAVAVAAGVVIYLLDEDATGDPKLALLLQHCSPRGRRRRSRARVDRLRDLVVSANASLVRAERLPELVARDDWLGRPLVMGA